MAARRRHRTAPFFLPALMALALWAVLPVGHVLAQAKFSSPVGGVAEIRGTTFTPYSTVSTGPKAAPARKGAARRYPELFTESRIIDLINAYSAKHGVDPKLVYALIEQESRFNKNAVSPKGAMGLMQIMPDTARLLGLGDPYDPEKNIAAGVRYLKAMLDRFETETMALAAYNAGPEAVARHGGVPPFDETRDYVIKVVDRYFFLRLKYPGSTIGEIRVQAAADMPPAGN